MSENQENQEGVQEQPAPESTGSETTSIQTSPSGEVAVDAEHHGPDIVMYRKVFIALCICTAASFGAFEILGHGNLALVVIMLISMLKAFLVTTIFMHLKWDWGNLYFLIIPSFILGTVIILVLLPDIVYVPYPS